ncbi:MAG: pyridoxal-dependent decarboxylase [Chloroflexaceae bacterium]|jgi:L-2,4-diaminobutyrate decarboxylase|nr:pyridoxal-dependent decarboxylase [Chloroflexaceae bacterium]
MLRGSRIDPRAFVHPAGHNQTDVMALTQQVLEMLVGHLAQAASKPLQPDPGSLVLVRFPEQPQPADVLVPLIQQVLDGAMNPAHPGYIGHMDTMPSTAAWLGELVSAACNNNMLSLEMAPFATRLEDRVVRLLAAEFGMGAHAGGVMLAGGTLANLQALVVARNARYQVAKSGMYGFQRPLTILASQDAHTSLQKAAMVMGLGSNAVVGLPVDAHGALTGDTVRQAIATQRAHGNDPFCVVATAGTTVLGAIDHLADIAAVVNDDGLWLHVDAAYGGSLILSPTHRALLAGIQHAHSLTFNPQKWMYVSKTAAMLIVQERQWLHDYFRIAAPYMGEDPELVNPGEISIQGTRHADVLKLWLTMQVLGRNGSAHLIDQSMVLAQTFATRLQTKGMQLAAPPTSNIVCFRPPGSDDAAVMALQQRLRDAGVAFFSTPTWRGQRWLRSVILNPFVDESRLQAIVDAL